MTTFFIVALVYLVILLGQLLRLRRQIDRDFGRIIGGLDSRNSRRPTVKHVCPVCGDTYWNHGAHREACRGPRP